VPSLLKPTEVDPVGTVGDGEELSVELDRPQHAHHVGMGEALRAPAAGQERAAVPRVLGARRGYPLDCDPAPRAALLGDPAIAVLAPWGARDQGEIPKSLTDSELA